MAYLTGFNQKPNLNIFCEDSADLSSMLLLKLCMSVHILSVGLLTLQTIEAFFCFRITGQTKLTLGRLLYAADIWALNRSRQYMQLFLGVMAFQIDIWSWFLCCPPQVDTSVFDSREMVQSLAFGLSFLQRMDMKLVVVMGLPPEMEEEDSNKTGTNSSLARTVMVKHCQALTEALQHNSANVMPFFSSEALLQLRDPQDESRFRNHFNTTFNTKNDNYKW